MTRQKTRFQLPENEIPTYWYNVLSDLPFSIPLAVQPKKVKETLSERNYKGSPQLPLSLFRQNVSKERYIEIPQEVRSLYALWRPTPLYRAHRLERHLETPAKIYYKYEGTSPTGSHKLNTAIAQAYYYKKAGVKHLTTGTSAAQWGSALALACNFFELVCTIYMTNVSYEQKLDRAKLMETLGAKVFSSPSRETEVGRKLVEGDPNVIGNLAISNAEALEHARNSDKCKFSVGSGQNHVLLHQTVIGQETIKQLKMAGDYPDIIIACVGGGSNFAGLCFPFISSKLNHSDSIRLIAVESAACPKLTRGRYTWDHTDLSGISPIAKSYTLGHNFVTPGIYAAGLRYHATSPIISKLYHEKLIEATAYSQRAVFEAGLLFSHTEGILPAPESAHAIRAAIDEAVKARERGDESVILFNLSGHGYFDLGGYECYLKTEMDDCIVTDKQIEESLSNLPEVELRGG